MASSNTNSPIELTETFPIIAESPEDPTRVLEEEIFPFSMSGEVGDVLVGVDEQSSIRKGIMTDAMCEQLWLFQ